MLRFENAVTHLLQEEGGLEDNPKDPGGITKYGISLRFLKRLTPEQLKQSGFPSDPGLINKDDIKQLTHDRAKALYFEVIWKPFPFARINNQNIINYLFDMVVNEGPAPAVKCLQRACWAVTKDRKMPTEDGLLGDYTLSIVNFLGDLLLPPMRSERAGDYRVIAGEKPAEKEFLEGWLNRAYTGI